MIKFTIPFPPMALPRHRHTRTGRTYELASSKQHKRDIAAVARPHFPKLLEGPLRMRCVFNVERPKSKRLKNPDRATPERRLQHDYPAVKPDLDNFVKMVCDAIEGIAFLNDSQVVEMDLVKTYTNGEGHTTVCLEPITTSQEGD